MHTAPRATVRAGSLALLLSLAAPCGAAVTPIGPFDGDLSEPLNQPTTLIAASIDIFGGAARLHSFDDVATAIHRLFSSQFAGDLVSPKTGTKILGFTTGPGWFEFDEPVGRFGAWWNNNSGTNGAMVEFFDADGALIDTALATVPAPGNVWTWNGWESTVPIAEIRVTGFGVIDGFLWFDDLELSAPQPACPDLDGDGEVSGQDVGILLSTWGGPGAGDLNGDGATDADDLATLLAAWGPCAG